MREMEYGAEDLLFGYRCGIPSTCVSGDHTHWTRHWSSCHEPGNRSNTSWDRLTTIKQFRLSVTIARFNRLDESQFSVFTLLLENVNTPARANLQTTHARPGVAYTAEVEAGLEGPAAASKSVSRYPYKKA